MSQLHLNELSLICDMWVNKITYLLTYLLKLTILNTSVDCLRVQMQCLSNLDLGGMLGEVLRVRFGSTCVYISVSTIVIYVFQL